MYEKTEHREDEPTIAFSREVARRVVRNPALSCGARLAFIVLADLWTKNPGSWGEELDVGAVADALGRTAKTVRKRLVELEQAGLIESDGGLVKPVNFEEWGC